MADSVGYEKVKCQLNFPGCKKTHAGYSRRKQYAQVGPWLDACENCARKGYDPPEQFQKPVTESLNV